MPLPRLPIHCIVLCQALCVGHAIPPLAVSAVWQVGHQMKWGQRWPRRSSGLICPWVRKSCSPTIGTGFRERGFLVNSRFFWCFVLEEGDVFKH